jgi:integrase
MMKFIPKNPDDLLDKERTFIETEPESNLYLKPDGSLWVRFTRDEMKVGELDVPLPRSVWATLRDYLFNHRPVLNREIRLSLNRLREIHGVASLTPEEERAIHRCPFLFRPIGSFAAMKRETLKAFKGTEQISSFGLRTTVLWLTQRFIPGCKGFSLHAFRHIVACEYIKNYPEGYEVAAAALNNTVEMVKKHYAWVRPCDRIRPWYEHFEKVQEAMEKGEVVN